MAASKPSQNLRTWETSATGVIAGSMILALALFMVVPVAANLPDSWPGGVLALALVAIGITIIRRSVRRERPEGSTSVKE